ncbi:hypothetical protein TWF481_001215 [Arthrobotrys musiformis]|uniref:Putative ER transporter 6TM N-terminal domain-containing protein n=1 Tax=Arthrobotrys musiformis TaxID=47236 RepID=A0AAV9WR05_9PEZI
MLMASTILLGICLAWAWGTIAFLAALSCRDDASYNATYNAILQAASQSSNPPLYAKRQIFNGALLQTPVTVVIVMQEDSLLTNSFHPQARLRAAYPKFTLTYIFGVIVIDVYITTGPLVNSFEGLLPLVFVKPLAGSVAIGLVLSLLVFPESCSYATLVTLSKSLAQTREILNITQSILQEIQETIPIQEINILKRKITQTHTLAEQGFAFIEIEPSIGRWSSKDIKSLKQNFRDLLINGTLLLNFHLLRQEYRSKILRYLSKDRAGPYHGKYPDSNEPQTQTLASFMIYEYLQPDPESAKLEKEAFEAMESLSRNILKTCDEAVVSSMEIIEFANTGKWSGSPKKSDLDTLVGKHTQTLDKLKRERERFHTDTFDTMIDPVSHFFDTEGKFIPSSDGGAKILGLLVGMNYKHRIMTLTTSLVDLLEHLIQLESENPNVRFWMPVAIRSLFSLALSPEPVYEDDNPEESEERSQKMEQKLKAEQERKERKKGKSAASKSPKYEDVTRIRRRRSKLSWALTGLYHWATNSDGAFAARIVISTLILTIPGVTKSGAKVCYDNRGKLLLLQIPGFAVSVWFMQYRFAF